MKLFIILIFIFLHSQNSYSQTYYNPKTTLDITIKVIEPYKPVNYSEIGKNINDVIQKELLRRETLKRYYDDITYETQNNILTNTYLTDDNLINEKIILLQNTTIENISMLNRLLKSGTIKPELYENHLRNTYFTFFRTNQIFLNLVKFNFINSENKYGNEKFKEFFKQSISSIIEFEYNYSDLKFILKGVSLDDRLSLDDTYTYTESYDISKLYLFITLSSNGFFPSYQKFLKDKVFKIENEKKEKLNVLEKKINEKKVFLDMRLDYLNKISEEYRVKYLKDEVTYVNKELKKLWKQYNKVSNNYYYNEKSQEIEKSNLLFLLNVDSLEYPNNNFFDKFYNSIVNFYNLNSKSNL